MKRRILASLLCLGALATPVAAQTAPLDGADPSIRPQDDFFRFANGGWVNKTVIPGDKSSYDTFTILAEQAKQDVRKLLEKAAAGSKKGRDDQLIGDFYTSLLDLPKLDRLGMRPLKGELARIGRIADREDLAVVLGEFQQSGIQGPIGISVGPDDRQPLINAVTWGQSGLGMPDRDYYLKKGPDADNLRKAYKDYLTTLYRLSGKSNPVAAARQVMAFETALAAIQWSRADVRDPIKTYNYAPRQDWNARYGSFPYERFAAAAGIKKPLGAIVNEPSYLKAWSSLAEKTPLETLKTYLRARLLDTYADLLGKGFREAAYRYHGQKLNGLTSMPPRWKTAVDTVNEEVGEAVGIRYVAERFSPASKQRIKTLVDNLLSAYREDLGQLDWMTPATRQAALSKLSKIRTKVGYPDRWRGYPGLVIKRGEALGNVRSANRFLFARDMREAGKAVDRSRWLMTPQTVNAYYSPVGNEIVFPAAILQPPFFDPKADDALNYGAIGAVIGHEITHGFDDQGRHYDADGRLREWWTKADEKAFLERTARLVAQYNAFEPLPGEHVNGRLTLGENIADLGGVTMALRAYHRSSNGKNLEDKDFFLSFARVWREKLRTEALHQQLVDDPHSPGQYRTNGVVENLDPFYDAFGLKPGDRLYKPKEERVHIW